METYWTLVRAYLFGIFLGNIYFLCENDMEQILETFKQILFVFIF